MKKNQNKSLEEPSLDDIQYEIRIKETDHPLVKEFVLTYNLAFISTQESAVIGLLQKNGKPHAQKVVMCSSGPYSWEKHGIDLVDMVRIQSPIILRDYVIDNINASKYGIEKILKHEFPDYHKYIPSSHQSIYLEEKSNTIQLLIGGDVLLKQ